MSNVAVRFDVDAQHADAWSDALLGFGAISVDACDARAGTPGETAIYAEPSESYGAFWPATRLTALFDGQADAGAVVQRAAASLQTSPPPYDTFIVRERDWVYATRLQFEPIRIVEGFWVVPSWCPPPDPSALSLSIDPGIAFGTGSHATTRLCLMWLHANVGTSISVLDYGCGSGILSIAAAKLGAGRVIGTDIDRQALAASRENARINAVDLTFVAPEALGDDTFDIVVANILTSTLLALAPLLAARVRHGGRVALSGILTPQADSIRNAYRRWFDLSTWRSLDDWSLIAGVRNEHCACGD